MGYLNLKKCISWILIFELGCSSFVMAEDSTSKKDVSTQVATGVQAAAGLMTSVMNQMNQQNQMQMAQQQLNQKLSWMDPTKCGNQGRCTDDVFPECPILKTNPNMVQSSLCKDGINPGDPQAQMKYAELEGFAKFFNSMKDAYKNYSSQGNKNEPLGIDCVANKIDSVNETLKRRELEIDNLISKIEKQQELFKQQAQADVDAITDAQALLQGDINPTFKRSLDKSKNNMFQDSFNDPGCNSLTQHLAKSGGDFNTMGKESGLRGIFTKLNSVSSQGVEGGYSAVDFDKTLRSNMEADIRKMADDMVKDFDLANLEELSLKNENLNSIYGFNESANFKASVKDTTAELSREFKRSTTEASQAFGNSPGAEDLMKSLTDLNKDFNQELRNYQNAVKNDCWNRSPVVNLILNDKKVLVAPTLQKTTSEETDSPFKIKLKAIINDKNKTMEQKIAEIKNADKDNGGKFVVRLNNTIVTEDRKFLPKDTNNVSELFDAVAQNCQSQFDNNPNSSGNSGKEVVAKATQIRSKLTALKSTMKTKLKNDILKRMVSCSDNQQANASSSNSCSPSALSPKSDVNFCLNKAFACATNMRTCTQKAKEKVAHVEKLSSDHHERYKKNVQKNKTDLMKLYAIAENTFKNDAVNIANRFKRSAFKLPEGLKFDTKTGSKSFLPDLDPPGVEDIDQYTDLLKTNLSKLKSEIQAQNAWVMNGDAGSQTGTKHLGLIGHLNNLKENHKKAEGEVNAYAQECINQIANFKRAVNDMNNKNAEAAAKQAEEIGKVCRKIDALKNNPVPGCGDAGDLADDMLEVAAFAGDASAAGKLKSYQGVCDGFASDKNTDEITVDKYLFTKFQTTDLETYCKDKNIKNRSTKCQPYLDAIGDRKNNCDPKAAITDGCQEARESLRKAESTLSAAILASANSDDTTTQAKKDIMKEKKDAAKANGLGEISVAACAANSNAQPSTDPAKASVDFIEQARQAIESSRATAQ